MITGQLVDLIERLRDAREPFVTATVVRAAKPTSVRPGDAALVRGLIVGALVAVNSVGSVFMPDGKTYWAWAFELDGELGGAAPPGAAPIAGRF